MPPAFNLGASALSVSKNDTSAARWKVYSDRKRDSTSPRGNKIGIYNPTERKVLLARFAEKRKRRRWVKKVRYTCRKNLADTRLRVKGRFVKRVPGAVSGAVLPPTTSVSAAAVVAAA